MIRKEKIHIVNIEEDTGLFCVICGIDVICCSIDWSSMYAARVCSRETTSEKKIEKQYNENFLLKQTKKQSKIVQNKGDSASSMKYVPFSKTRRK